MKRRGLFALLGGAAVVAPVAATAKGDEPMTASELSGLQSRYREAFIRAFDERIPDQFMAVNPDMAEYLRKGGR